MPPLSPLCYKHAFEDMPLHYLTGIMFFPRKRDALGLSRWIAEKLFKEKYIFYLAGDLKRYKLPFDLTYYTDKNYFINFKTKIPRNYMKGMTVGYLLLHAYKEGTIAAAIRSFLDLQEDTEAWLTFKEHLDNCSLNYLRSTEKDLQNAWMELKSVSHFWACYFEWQTCGINLKQPKVDLRLQEYYLGGFHGFLTRSEEIRRACVSHRTIRQGKKESLLTDEATWRVPIGALTKKSWMVPLHENPLKI